jgi:hypothetical protein
VLWFSFGLVGVVVAWHQPRNPMGWVLLGVTFFFVLDALSTLVAAALFNPVRHRVQHAVDRRFNRARYDADQTVAAFAARLQDAVDLGTVHSDLPNTVDQALEPAHVTVWTAPPATASQPG